MTKKIFYAVFTVCSTIFLASLLLTFTALYNYFSNLEQERLRSSLMLVEQGLETGKDSFLEQIQDFDYRLTIIETDGTVIYDNQADAATMPNHLGREEVDEALETGSGQSLRYSDTLTEKSMYEAIRLDDGRVLRISAAGYSVFALFMGIFPPLLLIFLAGMIISLVLAAWISKKIVSPLNSLDLDHPARNHTYEELDPLMLKLALSQSKIKSQKEELEMRKREFQTVTRSISEGLILLGSKGQILSINPAAQNILHPDEPVVGLIFADICPCRPIAEMALQSLDGKSLSQVVDWENESYLVEVQPVIQDKKYEGCSIVLMNVTSRQKIDRLRHEFTGNVSHELKTPLQTISGYSELLAEGMVSQDDVPDFAARIHKESGRMQTLINEIMTLSMLDESGEQTEEITDLKTAAESAVEELRPIAAKDGIEITLEAENALVRGNPAMLYSIVRNLTDNAVKYNVQNGKVDVRVFTEPKSGMAVVSVKDTGCGISRTDQERIFERFYRVDKSRSRQRGGTGLGLSIVRNAVRLHQGTVEVISQPGQGSEFKVRIPLFKEGTAQSAPDGTHNS